MSTENEAIDVNEVRKDLEALDKAPTGVISSLLLSLVFNQTAPVAARTVAAAAVKRLRTFEEIELPEGSKLLPLDDLAAATIAHSLGYYDQREAECDHFGGDTSEAPSNTAVESLARLIETSDLYVVIHDFEKFEDHEASLEAAEDAIQDAPGPDYPDQESKGASTTAGDIFDRPRIVEDKAPEWAQDKPVNPRVQEGLGILERTAQSAGITIEEAIANAEKNIAFLGEVIALARS